MAYNSTSGNLEYEDSGGVGLWELDGDGNKLIDESNAVDLPPFTSTEWNALTKRNGFIGYDSTLNSLKAYVNSSTTILALLEVAQTFTALQTFSGEIHLGLNKKIYLDYDKDTYIVSNADDYMKFYTGDVVRLMITDRFRCYSPFELYYTYFWMAPISTPGTQLDRCFSYGKDVAGKCEFHCMDEDGNETQLSSHDEDGYYIHRSTIPKRNLKLEIQIEKMIREHYPEYITDKKLNFKQKRSFKFGCWLRRNTKPLIGFSLLVLFAIEIIQFLWW